MRLPAISSVPLTDSDHLHHASVRRVIGLDYILPWTGHIEARIDHKNLRGDAQRLQPTASL
jgi:hypothetical protein